MVVFQILLILLYVFLIVKNYKAFVLGGKLIGLLTLITVALSVFLLCGSNAANMDWSDNELDISGYKTIYEKYDVLEHPDFKMYYIFYSCVYIGQQLGLSYRCWWAIMSVLAMLVIFIACRVHKYNFNLFLATFMAYYEIVFYSGFKFFYGFCFFLLAYGFLLRNTIKGKIIYAILTCLAGGFHTMYYFYLIFIIKPNKNPKTFVRLIAFIVIIFTIMMRMSGSAVSFLSPLFNTLDNEHINGYTVETVYLGFYIPVVLHLFLIYMIHRIKTYKMEIGAYNNKVAALYYSVLLSLLFCPFYAIALTFMRLLTSFSLVAITASSSVMRESYFSRKLCKNTSLFMAIAFLFMQLFISGFSLSNGFMRDLLIPYFDVF